MTDNLPPQDDREARAIAYLREQIPSDAPFWNDDGYYLSNVISWMLAFADQERAPGVDEALREALDVGETMLNKCMSAWSCGEPEHRVRAMLDAADAFRAKLNDPAVETARAALAATPIANADWVIERLRVERGSANSHCFDHRIVHGDDETIAFADDPWADRIVRALSASPARVAVSDEP